MFKTNCFPSDWKRGTVTPIPKKGDPTRMDNLRPITITHMAGKLLEKHMAEFMEDYMEDYHNIIAPIQMGFRKGYSTGDAITELVVDINVAMNHSKYTVCLFLDLRKVFDCVNHNILINKMQAMGFDPSIIKWTASFLTNRIQTVKVNNVTSEPLNVICGVPQGLGQSYLNFT